MSSVDVEKYRKLLEAELDKIELLNVLEAKTKVPHVKLYAFAGVCVLSLIILLFGLGSEFYVNVIGFAFPAYFSFKAIEFDTRKLPHWVSYWIIFAFMEVVESLFCPSHIIPFYFLLKFCFLVWLFLPQTDGSLLVYEKVIRPHILRHLTTDERLKATLNDIKDLGADIGNKLKKDF